MNGVFLRYWYSKLDRIVGSAMDARAVVTKIILDQLLLAPFAIGTYFSYSTILQQRKLSMQTFQGVKLKCSKDFKQAWIADCSVWPIANIACYGFVQLQYRVPFICLVQLGWQIYLANITLLPLSCDSPP